MRTLGTVVLVVGLLGCDNEEDGSGGNGGASSSTKASTSDVGSSTASSGSTSASVTVSTGAGGELFKSGQRLRVRKLVAADGSEQQIGFFDTQLDANCSFRPAEDGSMRCLPAVGENAAFNLFSDAACTVPLYFHTCGPAPKFAALETATSCLDGVQSAIYPLTGLYGGTVYHKTVSCEVLPIGSGEVHSVGPKMAPGAFVSATETVE